MCIEHPMTGGVTQSMGIPACSQGTELGLRRQKTQEGWCLGGAAETTVKFVKQGNQDLEHPVPSTQPGLLLNFAQYKDSTDP